MIHPKFRLIAPPFTPFYPDGSLNLSPIYAYANHLVTSGVRGVFVAGTTGEGQSLTLDERIALADAWAGHTDRSTFELIVHVGHNCQADAAQLAQHAESIGAAGIAMHAPLWFKRLTLDDLIDFCVPVAAAAPSLAFYLYDIPVVTGVQLSAAHFLARAKPRIPTLRGLKYTNPDCITVQECIQSGNGEYDVFWGADETLLVGAALGVSGAVGTTYSLMAPHYLRMLEAANNGDWDSARAAQTRAISMVRICERYTPLAALKFAMTILGIDCGPTRPPVRNLSEDEKRRLRTELVEGQYLKPAN